MRIKIIINIISIAIYLIGITLGLIIINYTGYTIGIAIIWSVGFIPIWTVYTLRYLREIYLPEKFTIRLNEKFSIIKRS